MFAALLGWDTDAVM